jgi:hypothetical protein
MQTLKAYLYPIILEVQIPDPAILTLRKRTVYSHSIKVYQGIDNPIQIIISNQDNKPVDLTGYTVHVDLQDPVNKTNVANYLVTFPDITRGRGSIIVDQATVDSLDQRIYKLTVKRINNEDDSETPAYVDANYGVPIDLVVLPGYYV